MVEIVKTLEEADVALFFLVNAFVGVLHQQTADSCMPPLCRTIFSLGGLGDDSWSNKFSDSR